MVVVPISNAVSSRDFYVLIKVSNLTGSLKTYIITWFLSRLDTISENENIHNNSGDYAWNILVDNLTFNPEDPKYIELCIHLEWINIPVKDITNSIFITEYPTPPLLSANTILLAMPLLGIGIPSEITAIGISGISKDFMVEQWWRMLDGSNGYLYNTIWEKHINNNLWIQSTDKSNLYKWSQGYPL